MKKLMFTVALAATSGALCAQEMGTIPAAEKKTTAAVAVAATATEGNIAVSVAAVAKELSKDGAQEIINAAIEKAPAMAAEDEAESARDLVVKKLKAAGLKEGYDRKRKAIIVIGEDQLFVENPVTDKNFMLGREAKAFTAYMKAKADIIKAINTEFEAVDAVFEETRIGEDPVAQKIAEKRAELDDKRDQLAVLLSQVNALTEEESNEVKKVTIGDRFDVLMDAVIKKVDAQYDPKKLEAEKASISADKQAKIANLRAECNALLAEYKQLESEANALKKNIASETKSDIKALSKMPLLGSTVITQAEAWDPEDKTYSVAMAVVWSPSLQEQAIKMISDDFKPMTNKGKYTVDEWVQAQEFSHMVGPRRFTDKDGMNLFVGISAVDLNGPVAQQGAKKNFANNFAVQYVACSLTGDLATYNEASRNFKVYDDDTNGASVLSKLSVNSQVKLNLNGCTRLAGKTIKHPLLNRKIYVAAYYIDPALAKEAKGYVEKLYNDAGLARMITKEKQAYTRGAQEMLKRIDATPIVPVHVNAPKLPPMPVMPKLSKPINKLSSAENAAAKKAFEEHKAKLAAQQKMIEERNKQIAAEKQAARDLAKKEQLEKEHQLLEQRKQKVEEEQLKTKSILLQLYKAVDREIDTNF